MCIYSNADSVTDYIASLISDTSFHGRIVKFFDRRHFIQISKQNTYIVIMIYCYHDTLS